MRKLANFPWPQNQSASALPEVPQFTMALLMATVLAIVAATYGRYGFTTDELIDFQRAQRVYDFLASRGANSAGVSKFEVNNFYGAMPDLLALFLQKLVPALSYDSRHLVSALFGMAGIFYIYRFGSKFVGEWVGVFAALFLVSLPVWFGYMFINLKDIPFAATLVAASYYSLLALTEHPTSSRLWLKTGLAIGLLATTKVVGLLILGFVVAIFIACFMIFPGQNKLEFTRDVGRRLAWTALSASIGCLVCFLIFWPQFYFYDIDELGRVVKTFMNFKVWKGTFLIQGRTYESNHAPWYYASAYFLISTPAFLLGLIAAGACCAIYRREAAILAAIIVCFTVFAMQALTGARVYNGCRHLLFLFPFFMLVAAYPGSLVLEFGKNRLVRFATMGVIVFSVACSTFEMYRLFPYEYSFYNSSVGGFTGADGLFYIDVWRSAYREALDEIASSTGYRGTVRVYSCGSSLNTWMHPGFEQVEHWEDADYVVALRRSCTPDQFDGLPIVGEVRRLGVLLARIYAARPSGRSE